MNTGKVFKSGNSQAVRLPKEFRVDAKEMIIRKRGDSIILTPKKATWDDLVAAVSEFSDDVFEGGRQQQNQQERDWF